jgi:hypothetical protein
LEQLDILEIQQTAIRQVTTEQEATAGASIMTPLPGTVEAAQEAKGSTAQSAVMATDADDSDSEAEHEEVPVDTTADVAKPTGSSATSTADNKKAKVSSTPVTAVGTGKVIKLIINRRSV